MDDDSHTARKNQDFNYISYMYKTKDGKIGYSGLEAEEVWNKFQIRLLKWEASPPIQNTYK